MSAFYCLLSTIYQLWSTVLLLTFYHLLSSVYRQLYSLQSTVYFLPSNDDIRVGDLLPIELYEGNLALAAELHREDILVSRKEGLVTMTVTVSDDDDVLDSIHPQPRLQLQGKGRNSPHYGEEDYKESRVHRSKHSDTVLRRRGLARCGGEEDG